ncbi:MAG TPA: ATP-binding protein [Opitutaceae bacterium]|nr:ATP-binding protein [Opitutaceae bacterium]
MLRPLRHPWRVALLVVLATVLNLLPVALARGGRFLFGPFVYAPLVLVLPGPWALLAAAIPMAATIHTLGHPFSFVLALAEAAWLVLIRRRWARATLLLDVLFWAVAGASITPWLYRSVGGTPYQLAVFIADKHLVNHAAAVGVAIFLVRQTPLTGWLEDRAVRRQRMRELVFHSVFVLALVPLALVGLGISVLLHSYSQRENREVLRETSQRSAQQLDLFFDLHTATIASAAAALEHGGANPSPLLEAIRRTHPAIRTMLVTDADGRVVFATPASAQDRIGPLHVADRDYFRRARDANHPFVSGVFRGQGVGRDILVAISAPLHDATGAFAGIVAASLEVHDFARLIVGHAPDPGVEFIFADASGRVLFADAATGIPPLAALAFFPEGELLRGEPRVLHFDRRTVDGSAERLTGLATRSEHSGIIVIAERPFLAGLEGSSWVYALFGGVALAIVGAAAWIARSTRRKTTAPLEFFAVSANQQTALRTVVPIANRFDDAPYEIGMVFRAFNHLAEQVRAHHAALRRHNKELDLRVAERTREAEAARQLAEAANRSKTEFLAMTGHEIRTPLNAIIGLADALTGTVREPAVLEKLHVIRRAGTNLLGVVNDLLDLSRIEAGKLTLAPAPVELGELCREVHALFALRAAQEGLRFDVEIEPPESAWVELDRARLQQVLINLVGNALKFTRRGGIRLCVDVARRDDRCVELRFAVIDTGPGIAPEQQLKLFQPFVQLPGRAQTTQPGSGLGLSISRRLVALFGGSLAVRSRVGAGSMFYFSVAAPTCAAPTPPAPVPVARDAAEIAKQRVLVVDDNLANQEVLRSMLELQGAQVTTVADGETALAEFARAEFALAFVDLELPGMDGFALVDALRRAQQESSAPGCRLIACSAHSRDQVWARCAAHDFDDFLGKPIDRSALRRMLQRPPASRATVA